MLEKSPETSKRFLSCHSRDAIRQAQQARSDQNRLCIRLARRARHHQRSYDLFSPGYAADLSVAYDGIKIMLDEDIRNGLVDKKFTLDRVINDRILKQAQAELRGEGKLKP